MKTLQELLTGRTPLSVPETATALEAARAMRDAHIGAMLVVGQDGGLLGIFTERDLMTRVVVPELDPTEVAMPEVMTRELFTASPAQRVNDVAREMRTRHIRHLPILEGGKVVGMLSLRDILGEHLDAKRSEVKALTAYIQGDEQNPAT